MARVSGTSLVALLRGINLGSRNRVAMAELRELFARLGHAGAVTHLQSGNVIFTVPRRPPAGLAKKIEKAIADELGVPSKIILRTRDELAEVVTNNPLPKGTSEPTKLMVSFLSAPADPKLAAQLDPDLSAPDEFRVVGREVYLWYPNGLHKSKLSNALFERKLGVDGTMRNWSTVTKLLELASAQA
jgi:uncharacterized protein (DUF1697 family)